MEGRAVDVLVAPLDVENVLAGVYQLVGDPVPAVALVLHKHLVTWLLRPVDADKEHVVAGLRAVHREGVLLAEGGALQARALALHRAGI